jgi:hypothetical protein
MVMTVLIGSKPQFKKSRTHLMLAIALVDLFSALRRDSYLDP